MIQKKLVVPMPGFDDLLITKRAGGRLHLADAGALERVSRLRTGR